MGRFSKKNKQSIQEEFRKAYANATDQQRAEVDDLFRYSQLYTSADPLNNRDSRQYAEQMYTNALAYLNGTTPGEMSPTASTKSIFGNYTHGENINNANTLTHLYFNSPYEEDNSDSAAYISSYTDAGDGIQQFVWNPNKGIDQRTVRVRYSDFDKREDREKLLIDNLVEVIKSNLSELSSKYSDPNKWNVRGYSGDSESIANNIRRLSTPLNKEQLVKLAQEIGVNDDTLEKYFNLPEQVQPDASIDIWSPLRSQGYEQVENDGLKQKGYYLWKNPKNGKIYVYDNTGNLVKNYGEYDVDYTKSNYGKGFLINSSGEYYDNDGNSLLNIPKGHSYYEQLQGLTTQYKNKYDNHFTTFSDIGDEYNIEQNKDIERFRQILTTAAESGKKYWADVSWFFNEPLGTVIAVSKNEIGSTPEGLPNLKDATIYYMGETDGSDIDFNGLIGQDNNDFTVTGRSDYNPYERKILIEDLDSGIYSGTPSLQGGLIDRIMLPYIKDGTQKITNDGEPMNMDVSGNARLTDDIINSILYLAINDANNPNYSKIISFTIDDRKKALQFLNHIKKYVITKINDPNYKEFYYNGFIQLMKDIKDRLPEATLTQKQGGVLYAKSGTKAYSENDNRLADVDKAIKKSNETKQKSWVQDPNRSVYQAYLGEQKFEVEPTDIARMTALALDFGQLCAAIAGAATGGVGNAAAAGLGITSTIVDFGADLLDPSISLGDTFRNGAINLGLGLGASIVPGLKTSKVFAKVAKFALKYAPIIISSTAIKNDPAFESAWQKLTNGQFDNFTRDEMMLLYRSIKTILSTGSAVASSRTANSKTKKVASVVESDAQPNKYYLLGKDKQPLVKDGKPVMLSKQQADIVKNTKIGKDGVVPEPLKRVLGDLAIDEDSFKANAYQPNWYNLKKENTPEIKSGSVSPDTYNDMRKAVAEYAKTHRFLNWMDNKTLSTYGRVPIMKHFIPGSFQSGTSSWDPVNKKWIKVDPVYTSPAVERFDFMFQPYSVNGMSVKSAIQPAAVPIVPAEVPYRVAH